jgi:hypothetical protein
MHRPSVLDGAGSKKEPLKSDEPGSDIIRDKTTNIKNKGTTYSICILKKNMVAMKVEVEITQ